MRIAFRASAGSFEVEGDVMTAWVSSGVDRDEVDAEYITVQRSVETGRPLADWEEDGLHFEYKDQLYGAYGVLGACRLGRGAIAFDLAAPLEDLEGVGGFDVELAIDDASYEGLREGLPRLFDGTRVKFSTD
ncbi:Imm10 family immunity protein [Paludisphaera soli]|uniref:Imm10 family immunity protein n=1 Tax=Paludisphaera soli TaxID=2712865 RepID=UPI0013ED5611|nr:Imm10 family immunity protein [Paludisphaera soli]